jgi:hypothetical protein
MDACGLSRMILRAFRSRPVAVDEVAPADICGHRRYADVFVCS